MVMAMMLIVVVVAGDAGDNDGGGGGYCGVCHWFDRVVVAEAAAFTMPSTTSPATCETSQP